jgi:hypothetical protein
VAALMEQNFSIKADLYSDFESQGIDISITID